MPPKVGGQANLSTKRKSSVKTDCPPKKPKVALESAVGLQAEAKKTATPPVQRKGKALMTGHVPVTEKPPNDYEDLSNHATEAMGETGLFSIA